jgi:small subunit ribosomal protein S8
MLTDPIADFLTRVRNTSHARGSELTVPSSKIIKAITQVLKNKHFIEDFEEVTTGNYPQLNIVLRVDREPLELKRISKPGQRIYVGYKEIKRVRNGLGIGLISTSRGILTDEEVRKEKLGGEYICEVY